jgi:hypothetical protein
MMGIAPFLRRFLRDESGVATIEFVIAVPIMFTFLFMGVELGLTMTRQIMLERAVDIAIRDLRLGRIGNPTVPVLRSNICDNTVILRNCRTDLLLELRRVSTTSWNYPTTPPACIDRAEEIAPVTTVVGGGSNDLMILRVCMIIDPLFPTSRWGLQLPLDASGGYQMFAVTSFVNEPR